MIPILISLLIDSTPPRRYPLQCGSTKGSLMILDTKIFQGGIDTLKNIYDITFLCPDKAVALYGETARYGVFVITTKKENK